MTEDPLERLALFVVGIPSVVPFPTHPNNWVVCMRDKTLQEFMLIEHALIHALMGRTASSDFHGTFTAMGRSVFIWASSQPPSFIDKLKVTGEPVPFKFTQVDYTACMSFWGGIPFLYVPRIDVSNVWS